MVGTALAATACSSTEPSGTPSTTQVTAPTAGEPDGGEPLRPGIDGGGATVSGDALTIEGFTFTPGDLRVAPNATVTVTNADGTDHSVTAVNGAFDTGRFSGGTRTITVPANGRFEYRCDVHSFMPHGFIQADG